jgi:hypothetical protein
MPPMGDLFPKHPCQPPKLARPLSFEFAQAQTKLVGKAVILTDGKAGTVENLWLDEFHGLRISIKGHEGPPCSCLSRRGLETTERAAQGSATADLDRPCARRQMAGLHHKIRPVVARHKQAILGSRGC